ncbi:MAG: ECF-type sigma factor [Phycisphaerales bacterium]|nr:ECF-type sigma factor [Phycisphaerales bacterium]MCI0631089.1 ECF-type sigma factor [Phycisphaerales bacterium]MCI0675289.1 ECF-type sigma factor [Phycisphaerales bacterium]
MTALADITLLLQQAGEGRSGALDELMRVVYAQLERMAQAHLRRQFGDRAGAVTLEPAALVNETYMKLIMQRNRYDNRGQFFAIATTVMMRVLIDYRRRRDALKRGGSDTRVILQFDDRLVTERGETERNQIEVEALSVALAQLDSLDPRKGDVVKMRVVWGLNNNQIAEALGVSVPTVERDWRFAKAWLAEQISQSAGSPAQADRPAED